VITFAVFTTVSAEADSRPVVVIDPGHGGRDPGAVYDYIHESDLNLSVAFKLQYLLESDGSVVVHMTRTTDVFISLSERSEIANEKGDLFVSIHHNASRNPDTRGVETFFFALNRTEEYDPVNRTFAEIMQRHLLAQTARHDRRARSANFAVLRNSEIPSTLVEIGFMSNEYELASLITDQYQWRAAQALFCGIMDMLKVLEL